MKSPFKTHNLESYHFCPFHKVIRREALDTGTMHVLPSPDLWPYVTFMASIALNHDITLVIDACNSADKNQIHLQDWVSRNLFEDALDLGTRKIKLWRPQVNVL